MNAPDLYIPLMGAGTYCLLICLAAAQRRKFKPELMTAAVSTTFAAWTAHTVLLKVPHHRPGEARCRRRQDVNLQGLAAEHKAIHVQATKAGST